MLTYKIKRNIDREFNDLRSVSKILTFIYEGLSVHTQDKVRFIRYPGDYIIVTCELLKINTRPIYGQRVEYRKILELRLYKNNELRTTRQVELEELY